MALIQSFYKVYRVQPEPDWFYIKNESIYTNSVSISLREQTFNVGDAEYKKENGQWTKLNYGASNTISLKTQEKVYLRATNWGRNNSTDGSTQITCNREFSAGGNIMSINNYTNMNATSIKDNLCLNMFNNQLIRIDFNLGNAEKIGKNSFRNMCSKNSTITSGPDFSKIKFIDTYGCKDMFRGCSAFSTTPDFSSLEEVKDYGLSYAFYGTALTETPNLSNVKIVSNYAFSMTFTNCANLSHAVAPSVSTWNTRVFDYWLQNVAASGVVNKPANLTIPLYSNSGVPSGWTTEDRE